MNAPMALSLESAALLRTAVSTVDPQNPVFIAAKNSQCIVSPSPLNAVRYLSRFLCNVNEHLELGGVFIGTIEVAEQRKARLLGAEPNLLRWAKYVADYVFHRVAPKLPYLKRAYFGLTGGRTRVVSKAEILGRLVASGFSINTYHEEAGLLHFNVTKAGSPSARTPSYGPLFRMRRVGQHGRIIRVYKLRTMHPFAEFLQSFIYSQNKLHSTGKINDDFRVMTAGRFLRRYWLDELPMLINLCVGDLKLVGVRPLSEHYFSLYPEPLAAQRLRHKPGLIPPFYADLPNTFDEVLASEKRYLDEAEARPWMTDAKYFLLVVRNILFRGARSR